MKNLCFFRPKEFFVSSVFCSQYFFIVSLPTAFRKTRYSLSFIQMVGVVYTTSLFKQSPQNPYTLLDVWQSGSPFDLRTLIAKFPYCIDLDQVQLRFSPNHIHTRSYAPWMQYNWNYFWTVARVYWLSVVVFGWPAQKRN